MRRARHCHKVCSLFGTVSALHYLLMKIGAKEVLPYCCVRWVCR